MQLDLTETQTAELWMILAVRIDHLEREINTHHMPDVRAIARRQLARTQPIFDAVNAHVTATA